MRAPNKSSLDPHRGSIFAGHGGQLHFDGRTGAGRLSGHCIRVDNWIDFNKFVTCEELLGADGCYAHLPEQDHGVTASADVICTRAEHQKS